jgi:N-carbamoyl-L-amino-acid hydrolase
MENMPDAIKIRETVHALAPRAETLFDDLRQGTADPQGGVTRASYGPGEQFGHDLVARHARSLGLEVRHDAARNTYMVWPGADRAAPAIVIGSHLDSVATGGNFDGAAGVMAGLVAVEALQQAGCRPKADIIVMGVRAEESAWFRVSYIGSRAALGQLAPESLDATRSDNGISLAEHIRSAGGDPEAIRRRERVFTPANTRTFLEVHIEQAPSLADAQLPIGIGTVIPGNFRYPRARIVGEYGHVGLPRRFRRDAALAGADFAMQMDRLWAQWDAAGKAMAFTIGEFHTDAEHHAMTKVPGIFEFSLDVRVYDEPDLAVLSDEVGRIVADIEQRRGVRFELGQRTSAELAKAEPGMVRDFEALAQTLGIPSTRLLSPASHDSAAFCAAGIPYGLLFVRNPNGSHHAGEDMAVPDFLEATAVLAAWLAGNACD